MLKQPKFVTLNLKWEGFSLTVVIKVLEFYFGKLDVWQQLFKVNLYLFVIGLVVFCLREFEGKVTSFTLIAFRKKILEET